MTRTAMACAIIAVAISTVASVGIVYGSSILRNDRLIAHEYRETGIDSSAALNSNAAPALIDEAKAIMEQKRGDELIRLKHIVKETAPAIDGGAYVDEYGNIVVQVASKSETGLEQKLINASERPDKVKIKYVKYSESQLRNIHKRISAKKDFGIVLSMTDIKSNKVAVFVSEDSWKQHKAEIANEVPEDVIDWKVGDFKFVDQADAIHVEDQR